MIILIGILKVIIFIKTNDIIIVLTILMQLFKSIRMIKFFN